MIPRTDRLTSAKIDLAKWTKTFLGCRAAANQLRQQGVPLELALRVLTRPARTRQ